MLAMKACISSINGIQVRISDLKEQLAIDRELLAAQ
jgi:hypothetical protein